MFWSNLNQIFPWPESIKQRLCRYLLEHYLGQYFEQKIVLQQLNIDLYNGIVTLNDINLNCNALNEQLKSLNIPFEIINGSVGSIFVNIPWKDLINENCKLEVKNINVTLRPLSEDILSDCNSPSASDMFSSVFLNSMQTSRQIAENCLRDECLHDNDKSKIDLDENFSTTSLTGLDALTRTIDSVLARIKINTENIHIRLEHLIDRNQTGYSNGIALEFHIKSIKYFDIDTLNTNNNKPDSSHQTNEHVNLPSITNKKFCIDGLTVYCDEFTIKENLLFHEDSPPPHSTSSNLMTNSIYVNQDENLNTGINYIYTNPVICATFSGLQEIDVTIKQPSISTTLQAQSQQNQNMPKLEVNAQFGSIKCFLCPKQIHLLSKLINSFSNDVNSNESYSNDFEDLHRNLHNNLKNSQHQSNDENYNFQKQKPIRGNYQQKFESLIHNDLLNMCNGGNASLKKDFNSTENGIEIKIDQINDDDDDDDDEEFQSFENESKLANEELYYSMLPPVDNEINLNSMIYNDRYKSYSIIEENDNDDHSFKSSNNTTNNENFDKEEEEDDDDIEFKSLNSKKEKIAEQIKHASSNQTQFELFVYKIKFTMFSLTVLQTNPENSQNKMLGDYMKNESETYFEHVSSINTSGVLNSKDFLEIRKQFFEACACNDHLLLLCKPINVQFIQKLDKDYLTITDLTLSIGNMELIEYLSNTNIKLSSPLSSTTTSKSFKANIMKSAIINEIIKFDSSPQQTTMMNEACLKLKYLSYEPTNSLLRKASDRRKIFPKVPFKQIVLNFNRLILDIDVSIIDRLYYLINPLTNDSTKADSRNEPIINDFSNNEDDEDFEFNALNSKTKYNSINNFLNSIDVKIQNLKVVLRFPIATFITPKTNVSTIDWRKRIIREQYLTLNFNDFTFQLNYYLNDFNKLMQISCSQINAYYSSLKISDKPILFAQVNSEENSLIKLIIKLNDVKNPNFLKNVEKFISESLSTDDNDLNYDSLMSQFNIKIGNNNSNINNLNSNSGSYSPFSSANSHISGKDNHRIINPANKYEMNKFIAHTKINSEVLINLKIPKINILLCDYDFLNDLYNCFLNDLLMWEPLAPKVLNNLIHINTPFENLESNSKKTEKFELCKSAILKTDDYDDEDDGAFSTLIQESESQHSGSLNKCSNYQPHKLCFILNAKSAKLKVYFYHPLNNTQQQQAKTLNSGEFDLNLSSFKLCVLSGHNGNINNQYMSLLTDRISLAHDNRTIDMNSRKSFFYPSMQNVFESLFNSALKPKELIGQNKLATGLFDTQTTNFGEIKLNNYRKIKFKIPMVSLALESKLEPNPDVTLPSKKQLKLALNINNACLNHLFCTDDKFWLLQLIELLNLIDIEISGYIVPIVVTELHLNITNSSIDYRPLKLDTKALIAFKSLRISSNVAQNSQATLLIFNVEDLYLFLTNYKLTTYDLRRDYVCVANADLFEFRLLINDKPDNNSSNKQKVIDKKLKSPILDIKIRSNLIQLRTCVDSCFCLIELLSYIGEDGDINASKGNIIINKLDGDHQVTDKNEDSKIFSSSPVIETTTQLTSITSPSTNIKNDKNVSAMVNEAMTQSVYGALSSNEDSSASNSRRNSEDYGLPFGSENKKSNESDEELSDDDDDDDKNLFDEFEFIDMIPGLGVLPQNEEYIIKNLRKDEAAATTIDENYFSKPINKIDVLKAPDSYPIPLYSYCVQEISIQWSLFGGHDMYHESQKEESRLPSLPPQPPPTTTTSKKTSETIEINSNKKSISFSMGGGGSSPLKPTSFEKSLPKLAGGRLTSKYDTKSLTWIQKGASTRNLDVCMEFLFNKVKTKVDIYNPESKDYNYINRIALAIGDIEITDKISTSAFNKFLFRYESDTCPKHTNSNMIFLKILCSRSDDMQRLIECDVKLSIQPLRFNIDQDALLFIVDYFKCLLSKQITFSNINNTNNNHSRTNDTQSNFEANTSTNEQDSEQKIEQKIFIRNFIFSPDLLIRFDFSGKYDNRTDNKLDTLTNILLILVQLSNTEIKLKHVCYKRGFLGIEKLLNCLLNDWVADIKNNQVKNLIKGWGLFNSLIQLFEGFSCLFWYPIEQYRKDGRVLFGIKKGSAAFSTCTVLATIELTNRLFQLTKNIAEFVYDLVTPHQTLSVTNGLVKNRNIRNRRQPNDIRQGLENAYLVLYEGFNDTAANIANDIITGKEHSGLRGAVGGALRQIPSAAIVPFVKAAEASSNILSGIRNQLKPDEKRDDEQKYKSDV